MTDEDAEDRYERKKQPSTVGELVGDVKGIDPKLGFSDEWWREHDRRIDEMKAQKMTFDERLRMANRAGELRDNGFPEIAIQAAFGELADTTAMRHARHFVEMSNHGLRKRLLILAGGVGTGKTTAATWIGMKGADPRPGFIRIAELERRGRYDRSLSDWLEDKTSLIIDDVGAEVLDGKGVFRALIDEIIDKFYANRRTLVMTTNLRPRRKTDTEQEQFLERYGDRVWSRLNELGEWGDCGTRDLRRGQL